MKAHADINTGIVYNAEPGTFKHYHELGHIEFNKNPKTSWMLMLKSYFLDIWMVFIMGGIIYRPVLSLAILLWLVYTGITLYEEWWCNKFAIRNIFKD